MIFLETSNDVKRLIHTAKYLYEKWGEPELAIPVFFAFATQDVVKDEDVLKMWSIGPECTVIVQNYDPKKVKEWTRNAASFTERLMGS